MPIEIIFCTLGLFLLLLLRVAYVEFLFSDWNYELRIYIELAKTNELVDERYVNYLKEKYMKPTKQWYKLHLWSIGSFVKDPFLLDDIHDQKQENYIN